MEANAQLLVVNGERSRASTRGSVVALATATTPSSSSLGASLSFGTHENLVQRYSYTGRELNEASGDYFFSYRMFGPELGEFFTRDPLRYLGSLELYRASFAARDAGDPYGLAPDYFNDPGEADPGVELVKRAAVDFLIRCQDNCAGPGDCGCEAKAAAYEQRLLDSLNRDSLPPSVIGGGDQSFIFGAAVLFGMARVTCCNASGQEIQQDFAVYGFGTPFAGFEAHAMVGLNCAQCPKGYAGWFAAAEFTPDIPWVAVDGEWAIDQILAGRVDVSGIGGAFGPSLGLGPFSFSLTDYDPISPPRATGKTCCP